MRHTATDSDRDGQRRRQCTPGGGECGRLAAADDGEHGAVRGPPAGLHVQLAVEEDGVHVVVALRRHKEGGRREEGGSDE